MTPHLMECPQIFSTDLDVLRLLGIFGEVESMGISMRGMEKPSPCDGAVFSAVQWTGTRHKTSKRPCFTKHSQEPDLTCKI